MHAGVLADPVIDRVPAAVADHRHGAAEAARNGAARPGAVGDLAHPLEAQDLQVGIPEPAFLLGEASAMRGERGLAGRQVAVVARPAQVEVLFQPARRLGPAASANRPISIAASARQRNTRVMTELPTRSRATLSQVFPGRSRFVHSFARPGTRDGACRRCIILFANRVRAASPGVEYAAPSRTSPTQEEYRPRRRLTCVRSFVAFGSIARGSNGRTSVMAARAARLVSVRPCPPHPAANHPAPPAPSASAATAAVSARRMRGPSASRSVCGRLSRGPAPPRQSRLPGRPAPTAAGIPGAPHRGKRRHRILHLGVLVAENEPAAAVGCTDRRQGQRARPPPAEPARRIAGRPRPHWRACASRLTRATWVWRVITGCRREAPSLHRLLHQIIEPGMLERGEQEMQVARRRLRAGLPLDRGRAPAWPARRARPAIRRRGR